MSIAVKTADGWQVLGAGESSGGGSTKWGDWTIVDAPDEQKTWSAPDSQGRIWKYVAFNTPGDYTINLTGGMYWVLVVSGGGYHAANVSYANQGAAGLVREGFWEFPANTSTPIQVGRNGKTINVVGMAEKSFVGDFSTQGAAASGDPTAGGSDFNNRGENPTPAYVSRITGVYEDYATDYRDARRRPGQGNAGAGLDPGDGCVIIATVDEDKTDYYPPGALPGVGGWATITGIDGTAGTRYQYGDWVAYEWTADGELTTSGGLVDALLIGGASGQFGTNGCNAGRANEGLQIVGSSEIVKVGQGNAFNKRGGETKLGSRTTGVVGCSPGNNDTVGAGGTDSSTVNVGYIDPYTSSIRQGTPETYGAGWHPTAFDISSSTGFGDGKGSKAGVVIVRVPKAHAYLGALPAGWVDA